MSFMKDRVEEIMRKSEEIARRLDSDEELRQKFFDAPQDTLIEAGLPPIVIGLFLKQSGFPPLGAVGFTPDTVAHFEAAAAVAAVWGDDCCWYPFTIRITCLTTEWTNDCDTYARQWPGVEQRISEEARRTALERAGLSAYLAAPARPLSEGSGEVS